MRQTIVVKIGGDSLAEAAKQLPLMSRKFRLVALHGAGKQIDAALSSRGIKTRKIGGLRITDRETLGIVEKEMRKVNMSLVAEIRKHGVMAETVDDAFKAKKKSRLLGYVGEITHVNDAGIMRCFAEGKLPVVMPVGYDCMQVYNINADTAAKMLVMKIKPDKLVMLSGEGGVKDKNGTLIREIKSDDIAGLSSSRTVKGGMRLKLEEAKKLLGATDVEITICSAKGLCKKMSGTKVVRQVEGETEI